MRRTVVILSGMALAVLGGYMLWHYYLTWPYGRPSPSLWLSLVAPLALLVPGICIGLYGVFSENIYRIKQGRVINHRFIPSHWVPQQLIPNTTTTGNVTTTTFTIIPGHQEPDVWSLQLEDEQGHTGWLDFINNVHQRYPIGNHYP